MAKKIWLKSDKNLNISLGRKGGLRQTQEKKSADLAVGKNALARSRSSSPQRKLAQQGERKERIRSKVALRSEKES